MARVQQKTKQEGTKRKPKVFAENLGIDHLVQLSNDIAAKHENALQERVDRAKDKQSWIKEKNRRKNGMNAKQDNAAAKEKTDKQHSDTTERPSSKPLTKSNIRAGLVAAQREKTRMRKEARKVAQKATKNIQAKKRRADIKPQEEDTQEPETEILKAPKKRVSFAA
ncbi:uncharacterized protein FA14DRAFT_154683 [Meira miltonrushii]|uniref:Uncharacterized protein n=1 Tax=Meira miltonrushii TaxID=1280837 RepID=A0A316VGY0_9BASI|nr:uncharacterized protein FA14DRAFT_154683 [Meira miltonrushii]PWN35261.1 hypothetical protein FA14DRAFT_154683 [Meira miltonrushii]